MKGCLYEIDDAVAFCVLFKSLICLSFLSVVSSFDDFLADLGEELINSVDVLVS